jgi:hypothetical protein
LSQDNRPVDYFSEKLNDTKDKYSTYDIEFYVVIQSLKKWRHYLIPKEFVLYSDNQALKFITKQEKLNQRHAKWVEFMKNFTFVIKHIYGSANKVSYALSRRSLVIQEFQVKTLGFDVNLPSTARSPHQDLQYLGPKSRRLFQLPREFFTHSLLGDLLFAYREIGSRDIARLATLSLCNQTPKSRSPMVNGQYLGISPLAMPSLCISEPQVPRCRCHVLYSTQSPWDPSQLALSRFLRAPFDFANAEMPSPESWGSRATCPSND